MTLANNIYGETHAISPWAHWRSLYRVLDWGKTLCWVQGVVFVQMPWPPAFPCSTEGGIFPRAGAQCIFAPWNQLELTHPNVPVTAGAARPRM